LSEEERRGGRREGCMGERKRRLSRFVLHFVKSSFRCTLNTGASVYSDEHGGFRKKMDDDREREESEREPDDELIQTQGKQRRDGFLVGSFDLRQSFKLRENHQEVQKNGKQDEGVAK